MDTIEFFKKASIIKLTDKIRSKTDCPINESNAVNILDNIIIEIKNVTNNIENVATDRGKDILILENINYLIDTYKHMHGYLMEHNEEYVKKILT